MKWLLSIFSILLFFQIFDVTTAMQPPPQFGIEIITAHRGSSSSAPENTLAAVQQAIHDRAGIVEIDVRMTADGIIVLSHDDSLLRTAGIDKNISELPFEKLQDIDIGSRFHSDYQGETLITLEQLLSLTQDKIKLNIELKMDPVQPELPSAVVRALKKHDAIERSVITSFNMDALMMIKDLAPEITTGLIVGSMQQFTPDLYTNPFIDVLSLRGSLVNRHVVQQARIHHKKVFVWTINREADMKKMARYGVDSIITDKPDVLFSMLF